MSGSVAMSPVAMNSQRGFTLIELVVVMGILTIFASFLVQLTGTSVGLFQDGERGQDLADRADAAASTLHGAVGAMIGPGGLDLDGEDPSTRLVVQWVAVAPAASSKTGASKTGAAEAKPAYLGSRVQVLRSTVQIDAETETELLRPTLLQEAAATAAAPTPTAIGERLDELLAAAPRGGRAQMLLVARPAGDADGAFFDLRRVLLLPGQLLEIGRQRYVDMMGGADAILSRAQADFDKGEYRWVAELLNHLVFAQPDNAAAKSLLAQTYDQLAYQAESGPWRDVYLTGALELRRGAPEQGLGIANARDLINATPVDQFFELMAVMLNGPKADGKTFTLNIQFTDMDQMHTLQLENAVLHHRTGNPAAEANATIRITHALFVKMLTGDAGIRDILFSDDVSVEGSKLDLLGFFALMDRPNETFNIVTP